MCPRQQPSSTPTASTFATTASLAREQGLMFVPPSMMHTESDDWLLCAPLVLDQLVEAAVRGRVVAAFERRSDLERARVRLAHTHPGRRGAGDEPQAQAAQRADADARHLVLVQRQLLLSKPELLEGTRMLVLDRLPLPLPVEPGFTRAGAGDPHAFLTRDLPEGVSEFASVVQVYLQRRAPGPFALGVLDARLTSRPYGRWFLRAIPWMPRTYEVAAVEAHLGQPCSRGEGSQP